MASQLYGVFLLLMSDNSIGHSNIKPRIATILLVMMDFALWDFGFLLQLPAACLGTLFVCQCGCTGLLFGWMSDVAFRLKVSGVRSTQATARARSATCVNRCVTGPPHALVFPHVSLYRLWPIGADDTVSHGLLFNHTSVSPSYLCQNT